MAQENCLEVWSTHYKRTQLSHFILHISIFFLDQWYLIDKRSILPQVSLEICTSNVQLYAFTGRQKLFYVKLEFLLMINVVPQVIKVSAFAAREKAFLAFSIKSSVSSLHPNAWINSPLPSIDVLLTNHFYMILN